MIRARCMMCGAVAALVAASPGHAIVGGAPEDGAIARNLVQVSICSGVLIAEDVVLTAGHCSTGRVKWRSAQLGVQSRGTREAKLAPGAAPTGDDIRRPPIDLALLRLDAPVTPPLAPATLSAIQPPSGLSVVISGFGEETPGQQESAGALRSAAAPIVEPYGQETAVAWVERDGRTGACKGDSGGAMSRDGVVFGVVTSIVGPCGYRTRAVLLGPQRAWIDETLRQWGRKARWR